MSKKSFPIYLDSRYREMIDSIVADAKRITPNSQHFTPQWSTKGRSEFEVSFESTSDDVTRLLLDIYIYGNSSIFEKSVMYDIAKQTILVLELRAIRHKKPAPW